MDRVVKGILIMLWLALLTSGCVTMRMYEGEQQLPKEQIAIIKGSFKYYLYAYLQVYLKEVDGIGGPGELQGSSVEVLPGWHEIVVGVKRIIGGGNAFDLAIQDAATPHNYYALSFYAMPGHKYRAKSSFWKTKNALVTVVDTRSGKIVASQRRKSFESYTSISRNWGWCKPDVSTEQLNQDYCECRAKGLEKSCMKEKGYTWEKF